MKRATSLGLAVLGLLVAVSPAGATRFRRPYHPDVRLNAGYDNNGGGGCSDYGCGGVCSDGHTGSDFNLGIGNTVLAGADGTVTQAVMGCPRTSATTAAPAAATAATMCASPTTTAAPRCSATCATAR